MIEMNRPKDMAVFGVLCGLVISRVKGEGRKTGTIKGV